MSKNAPYQPKPGELLRLHIGGEHVKEGWKIVNIQVKPGIDFQGSATDLSRFADGTVDEVYGSHIYEHLGYIKELPQALREVYRVLKPGGVFKIGVPDLSFLCWMMLSPLFNAQERLGIMRVIYGGQTDEFDFHKVGYTEDMLVMWLDQFGFVNPERVDSFGLFPDTTDLRMFGLPLSLNVQASKPG